MHESGKAPTNFSYHVVTQLPKFLMENVEMKVEQNPLLLA
jgi:hypothetical protein